MSQAIKFKNRNNEDIYPCPYFPVGSIYLAVTDVNPESIFGGKWEKIKDKFLLTSGNQYHVGNTGGSSSHYHSTQNHTLTINEMPRHHHTYFRSRVIWAEPSSDSSTVIGCQNTWEYGKTYPDTYDTGNSEPHNHGNTGTSSNMPPYLVINAWKRTA